MYSTLFTTTLFFALAILRVTADFTVYTPELTQCQPVTINWDATNGPYDVIIVRAEDPCGDELADLGYVDANTYQWPKVAIPAGTEVMISVMDANDQEGWSGSITVKPSDDNSCLTTQNTPPSTPTPTPQPPSHPTPSSSSSTTPTATVVGAANNGLIGSGVSILRFNNVAVFVTVLGALAALL